MYPYKFPYTRHAVTAAGCLGLLLRLWLFSGGTDEKGLLIDGHIAGTLAVVLIVPVAAALLLWIRPLHPISNYSHLFPRSVVRAAGCIFAASGILYTVVADVLHKQSILSFVLVPLGILSAAAFVYVALCRWKGQTPHYLAFAVVTVFMMLYAVSQCRVWGSEPQILRYLHPLLALIMTLLTCYHHTLLAAQPNSRRKFVFYSLFALFFCLCSSIGDDWLLYLGFSLWLLLDPCDVRCYPRHNSPQNQEHTL